MKTNLDYIWQKWSWRNLQQNYVEQMSDLFNEHRYFKFQDEIQFFHITTMEHWNFAIQNAFVAAISCKLHFQSLASYHLHDGLCWCHFYPNLLSYLSWWAPNARCRSRRCFHAFHWQRSTMLTISGANVFIAGTRVDITLNIYCNICDWNLSNLGWLISCYLDILGSGWGCSCKI